MAKLIYTSTSQLSLSPTSQLSFTGNFTFGSPKVWAKVRSRFGAWANLRSQWLKGSYNLQTLDEPWQILCEPWWEGRRKLEMLHPKVGQGSQEKKMLVRRFFQGLKFL